MPAFGPSVREGKEVPARLSSGEIEAVADLVLSQPWK
jgi:hypothetical protein